MDWYIISDFFFFGCIHVFSCAPKILNTPAIDDTDGTYKKCTSVQCDMGHQGTGTHFFFFFLLPHSFPSGKSTAVINAEFRTVLELPQCLPGPLVHRDERTVQRGQEYDSFVLQLADLGQTLALLKT